MKKLFLVLALILMLALALAACNDTSGDTTGNGGDSVSNNGGDSTSNNGENVGGESEHVFRTEWTYDNEKHWCSCIDLSCDVRKNEAYHTFGEWVIDEAATCMKAGTKHHTCLVCGKSVSESIPVDMEAHNFASSWTSNGTNHWHKCQNIGCSSKKDETSHTFGEWIVSTAATCMKPGTRKHVCTVCNKAESESIPIDASAHNYASTFTSDDTNHWLKCQNSGCSSVSGETTHTFGAWIVDTAATCMKTGTRHHVCAICNKSVSETIPVDTNAHNYATTWTSDNTDHWHKCLNSGCTSVSDKTAHTFGEWMVDKAATCATSGARHHVCTACNKSVRESIPASTIEHNYSTTWSTDGTYHWHGCTTRGCASVSDKTSHTWDNENTCTICQRYKDSGVKFTKQSNGTYTVSDYTGSASEVIIPSVFNGCAVTSIGWYAFSDCTNLTSIIIPNSVMSIGEGAFSDCTSLTNITIPDSVTSISSYSFNGSGYYTNDDNWENGVLYIGKWLIKVNQEISGFYTIKDGTASIASGAFAGCSLKSVTIPDSVTSIGDEAFRSCPNLRSVTFGENCKIKTIGFETFYGCIYLTSIIIPNSVTSIGEAAFRKCTYLQHVTFSNSVTSIGESAFASCSNLYLITFDGTKAQWDSISKGDNWKSRSIDIKCIDAYFALKN